MATCETCGCGEGATTTITDVAGAAHEHEHDHGDAGTASVHTVVLEQRVLAKNEELADRNRARLAASGAVAVNVMGSPSAGKTTLLERTVRALGARAAAVLASVTEGADKPLKYPHMFRAADLVVLTKTDILPYVDFDVDVFVANADPDRQGRTLRSAFRHTRPGAGLRCDGRTRRPRRRAIRERNDRGAAGPQSVGRGSVSGEPRRGRRPA